MNHDGRAFPASRITDVLIDATATPRPRNRAQSSSEDRSRGNITWDHAPPALRISTQAPLAPAADQRMRRLGSVASHRGRSAAGLPAVVEELLADVVADGFSVYCCGPKTAPHALVASYEWP